MFQPEEIYKLDIETTNSCNALCPQCSRTPKDGTNPNLNFFLDFEIFKHQVSPEFLNRIKYTRFNGTTGDNAMHPDIIKFCEYVLENNTEKFMFATNGGMRDQNFWIELGKLITRDNTDVRFALDGLEDTHSLYRVNIDWNRVISHAESFIKSGGNAVWQMIVFKHNQHQIEDCRLLSKKLGFKRFEYLTSNRFGPTLSTDVYNKGVFSHKIEKTTIDIPEENTVKLYNHFNKLKIDCESKDIKWVGIYADGTVWPCCYMMGSHVLPDDLIINKATKIHLKKYLKLDKFDSIDLHHHKIEDIIRNNFYQQTLPNSIDNNPNPICINECRIENRRYDIRRT
jgi:MoaA/NifB/PqqE/SkfB family radical SAM enzyme